MDVYMDQDLPLSPTLSFYVNETEWWTTVSLNPIVPPHGTAHGPIDPSLCNWILVFLWDGNQGVTIGSLRPLDPPPRSRERPTGPGLT